MVRMLFIALALLLVQPAFLTRPALAADPYSIDVLLPVTGGGAFFGKAEADALRVYEGVVNKSGGIHGQPVHFDVHDDQSNPIIDLQLVRQITQRHPAVILGPSVSATAEAIVPLFNDGPVLYVFSPGIVPPTGSYVFAASATLEANVLSAYAALKGLGYKRIAVITATDATGQKNLEFTKEYFSSKDSRGLELVANEQFAPADVSVAAQAAKLRAAKPDSIMIWAAGAPFGTALRDIANAGINVTIATSPLNANPDQLAQYASFLPKDLVLQGVPYQGKSMSPALAAAAKEYLDALKDAGLTPAALFPYSWDPAKLIVTALRALPQNPSGAQLRAYLATMHGVAGVFGTYDFRRGDQHGLSGSDFPFIRYDAEHRTWTPFDSGPSK